MMIKPTIFIFNTDDISPIFTYDSNITSDSYNRLTNKLSSVIIGDNVVSLDNYCFHRCFRLQKITFTNNARVKHIKNGCFCECDWLTSVYFPSSVLTLGDNCFNRCNNLSYIIIPSSVMSLGSYCFTNCGDFTCIFLDQSSVRNISTNTFNNVKDMTIIYYNVSNYDMLSDESKALQTQLNNDTMYVYNPSCMITLPFTTNN